MSSNPVKIKGVAFGDFQLMQIASGFLLQKSDHRYHITFCITPELVDIHISDEKYTRGNPNRRVHTIFKMDVKQINEKVEASVANFIRPFLKLWQSCAVLTAEELQKKEGYFLGLDEDTVVDQLRGTHYEVAKVGPADFTKNAIVPDYSHGGEIFFSTALSNVKPLSQLTFAENDPSFYGIISENGKEATVIRSPFTTNSYLRLPENFTEQMANLFAPAFQQFYDVLIEQSPEINSFFPVSEFIESLTTHLEIAVPNEKKMNKMFEGVAI